MYEEALKYNPISFQLWYNYLKESREYAQIRELNCYYEVVNALHERCLFFMPKFPRIWIDFITFLMSQGYITRVRRTFDLCLKYISLLQHELIWDIYLKWVKSINIKSLCISAYKRYIDYSNNSESVFMEYVNYLINNNEIEKAFSEILPKLDDESTNEYWQIAIKIVSNLNSLNRSFDNIVEKLIRKAFIIFPLNKCKLYITLVNYFIKNDLIDKARNIFEEGINVIDNKRDFNNLFKLYISFEEKLTEIVENNKIIKKENVYDGEIKSNISKLFPNIKKNKQNNDQAVENFNSTVKKPNDKPLVNKRINLKSFLDKKSNDNDNSNKGKDNEKSKQTSTFSHKQVKYERLKLLVKRKDLLFNDLELRIDVNDISVWLCRARRRSCP